MTQPDRPRGRGHKTSYAPVKARALEAAVPVLQPATLKDSTVVSDIAAWHADIGVVARVTANAAIDLQTPSRGMVNVHASLLPYYRGAAPVHRAVMAGDSQTGVTIMRVVKALDAGPMLATVHRWIDPDETSEDVEHDLAQLVPTSSCSTLD